MYAIALRYSDKFAPEIGTICAHEEVILRKGFVWYGKFGSVVSDSNIAKIMSQENPRILLIQSGGPKRYWAYVSAIRKEFPDEAVFPEYYKDIMNSIHMWFRVTRFEQADKNVMSKCIVSSSKSVLSEVSKHSMSPYFLIEFNG